MSQAEVDRFTAAVEATPSLLAPHMDVRTPVEMAARLQAAGYDITAADVEASLRCGLERSAELSDADLDRVSGGVLLTVGIGLGVAAFCAIPALVSGAVAVGLVAAQKAGVKIG
ncbi:Nif11-like leader peptide family RiPP precursor [Azospirillum cavernae]|nr:Nif11-like leader peptide family RiPP precursor [Azospirillum cavernae]